MTNIQNILAREILDSRGNPTVEVDVTLDCGVMGRAAVPSGASTGEHEAIELRDGDKGRYLGKGVQKAVKNVGTLIAPKLIALMPATNSLWMPPCSRLMARKPNPSLARTPFLPFHSRRRRPPPPALNQPLFKYIGGPNAKVLPVPMANVINGGAHLGCAD